MAIVFVSGCNRMPSTRKSSIQNLVALMLAAALSIAGCSRPPAPSHHARVALAREAIPLGKLPRQVIPSRYRIALTVDPTAGQFSGHVEIDVKFLERRRDLFLHGRGLNVLAASVRLSARHSIPAHYLQVDKSGVARLIFVDEVPAGKATLVFDYDAPYGKSLSGLYKVVDRGDSYAFTQFESISAREAFPSFDEPGFKTPFQLTVSAPESDKVVSNAPVEAVYRSRNTTMTTRFQWTRPLPTYLVALAVGPLDIVDGGEIPPNQYRTHAIRLRGITAKGNGQRIRYALSLTPKIVQALEAYFSVSYPFQKLDVLAVPDFAAGAMENAGAITFRERLLLLDTDASLDQKRSSLAVQAHEISHQWFGDLVTPSWWDDVWLNESFATWMEYKISQQVLPEQEFDTETLRSALQVMDQDELPSARPIREPVHNPDDIDSAFDSITYDKGAATLSMFEGFLGEDLFRSAVHTYLTKFAFGNAAARDFIAAVAGAAASHAHAKPEGVTIEVDRTGSVTWNGHHVPTMAALIDQLSHMAASASPQQISTAFYNFIDQQGVPYLRFHSQCDGYAQTHANQSPYSGLGGNTAPRQWRIPLCLGVEDGEKFCRIADRPSTDILLGSACPTWLMPNDEGRGYYRFALDEGDWSALIQAAPKLSPADQITLVYNLFAALRAGDARAADLLQLVHSLASVARWDVLDAIENVLHQLRLEAIGSADLSAYRAFVAANFSNRFDELGTLARVSDTPAQALARERLGTLMVSEARDVRAVKMLTAAAVAQLSGGVPGTFPAPELTGEAMRAGLIAKEPDFAETLIKSIEESKQEFFRRQAVYAFAVSEDPAVLAKLLAFANSGRMRTGELRYLYQYLSQEPVASEVLWNWYKKNYSTLLARVSRDRMASAPSILAKHCDVDSRNELDNFFAPKTDELTGTLRTLALAEQRISRCIAFRQAKGQEVAAALRNSAH